jgi:hypothetical protein
MNTFQIKGQIRNSPARFLWFSACAAGFLSAAVGARVWLQSGLAWSCPTLTLFGVPCPSCGSTRAFAALVEFDLLRALSFNPLVVAGLVFLLIAPLFKLRFEKRANLSWIMSATAVGLNWLYLLLFLPR